MQQLSALKNRGPEELLNYAVQICGQNDEMLGSRLLRILNLSSSIPPGSRSVESLEFALRIFCFIGDMHKCSDPFARDQLNACIEEISRVIATSLVKRQTSSNVAV